MVLSYTKMLWENLGLLFSYPLLAPVVVFILNIFYWDNVFLIFWHTEVVPLSDMGELQLAHIVVTHICIGKLGPWCCTPMVCIVSSTYAVLGNDASNNTYCGYLFRNQYPLVLVTHFDVLFCGNTCYHMWVKRNNFTFFVNSLLMCISHIWSFKNTSAVFFSSCPAVFSISDFCLCYKWVFYFLM